MYKPTRNKHKLLKIMSNSLFDLPSPSNISVWWNMGSLLGICIVIQFFTGMFNFYALLVKPWCILL